MATMKLLSLSRSVEGTKWAARKPAAAQSPTQAAPEDSPRRPSASKSLSQRVIQAPYPPAR